MYIHIHVCILTSVYGFQSIHTFNTKYATNLFPILICYWYYWKNQSINQWPIQHSVSIAIHNTTHTHARTRTHTHLQCQIHPLALHNQHSPPALGSQEHRHSSFPTQITPYTLYKSPAANTKPQLYTSRKQFDYKMQNTHYPQPRDYYSSFTLAQEMPQYKRRAAGKAAVCYMVQKKVIYIPRSVWPLHRVEQLTLC